MNTLLHEPLATKTMRDLLAANPDTYFRGVVEMELSDLIDNDLDGVLNLMSEKLTGTGMLTDIKYKIVGFEGETTLHIEVSGDLSQIVLDDESENNSA